MRRLNRLAVVIFLGFLLVATVMFVLENQQLVSLGMFGWSLPDLPVALPVLAAFVLGLALGPLLRGMARVSRKH
ncbi:lipopolysaccharide assembly protein LapA domain-containing protein [Pseudomonas putida]|uniref:lipopolysaccharide assembly protein LapA domain-containing protein n=1 Tax=Pseudomonas putida TaxID=303 RepID=UPI0008191F4D|nr:lipopolysaccharide assembly protein LapA domain-containing protein [Pseudomonas putida]OCT25896.1 hypothetical protein A6E24_12425 [Pseudomonas putida]OCT27820.1 hypothetical protein A6E23_08865 [Pseudomonas putida]OCT32318.1 hypothetical protein A6E20_01650 [Pseudomonas putida]OCT38812.1 hypothetical protein A6E19_10850 [Pseudomonas putida]